MPKQRSSLDEILASTSDVLFPNELGEKHVSISSQDCNGDTPLHVMVWRNDVNAGETLINAGANVNAIGEMGESPLHVAVRNKNQEIIVALLAAGAKKDIRSEFSETPLEKAQKVGAEIANLFKRRHMREHRKHNEILKNND